VTVITTFEDNVYRFFLICSFLENEFQTTNYLVALLITIADNK